jgi:hypothetical protein
MGVIGVTTGSAGLPRVYKYAAAQQVWIGRSGSGESELAAGNFDKDNRSAAA